MKRLFYLLSLIAVVALVIFIGYFFRYRSEPIEDAGTPSISGIPAPLPQAPPVSPGLPTRATIGTLPILETDQAFGMTFAGPVRSFFIDGQRKLFVVTEDGRIIRVGDGEQVLLSAAPIENLISAEFSFDGTRVLVAFGDPSAPHASVFDIATALWQPLPANTLRPVWAPGTLEVAYLSALGEKTRLSTLDLRKAGAKPQTLIELHLEDMLLEWRSSEKIFLFDPPSSHVLGSLWEFDIKRKTLALLIEERRGLSFLWKDDGSEGLMFESGVDDRGGRLFLVDEDGQPKSQFSFLSLPSKCLFTEKNSLICAIPRDSQKLNVVVLPDAYLKRAMFTEDNLYEINLGDGSTRILFADTSQSLDMQDLNVFYGKLFFVNRLNGGLYAISLPDSG